MERVTYTIAKAIKEDGYPQGVLPQIIKDKSFPMYYNGDFVPNYVYFYANYITTFDTNLCVACPTYLEVWLWLWREKDIKIDIDYCINKCAIFDITQEVIYSRTFDDPEEAIKSAIEYVVDNKLIK